jgi:hypothetical protein
MLSARYNDPYLLICPNHYCEEMWPVAIDGLSAHGAEAVKKLTGAVRVSLLIPKISL